MTDTLGRMHSDAQFAGSSSVPAHVEMMGFLGIGNIIFFHFFAFFFCIFCTFLFFSIGFHNENAVC